MPIFRENFHAHNCRGSTDFNFYNLPPPTHTRCAAQQSQCPSLGGITNGFITYAPDNTSDYDLGTVATYACDTGFVLDLSLGGSEMRTCVDGFWNNQEPSCIFSKSSNIMWFSALSITHKNYSSLCLLFAA